MTGGAGMDSRTLYLRILSYVRPHWRVFAIATVGMIAAAATEPLFPALIKPLLDSGFGGSNASHTPFFFAAAIVGIFVLRGILTFFSSYCMHWVGHRVVLDMRTAMFERLVRFPARYFDEQSSGQLLSRVAYDVSNIMGSATNVVTIAVKDSIALAGLLGYLFYLNWKLSLIALAVGPIVAVSVRVLSKRLRTMARGTQESMGGVVHVLEESIQCHKIVKVFGGQEYESARFRHAAQRLRGFYMRLVVPEALTTPITHTLAAFALATIVYLAMQEAIGNRATPGEFASFLTAALMLLAPMKRLTELNSPIQRGLAAAESVFGMIDAPVEEDRGTVSLARAQGRVTYEGVGFRYETRKEPALLDVSLDIRPGETVALVGGSGAGKTTLVNLLPRFYAPDSGRILLDGHDIQELTLASLRANLALVSQEIVLFNDSIFANIAYGTMARVGEREVMAAAEAAHALAFIRELPEGLDTVIGESGLRLSGGQRQRIAIARALLKNAPVLILDEATSALDSESERQVQGALDTLMQGRTTIVIAHRLSTIERADRIVALDRGRIAEVGSHAQLIARDGLYARLHRTQFAPEPVSVPAK